MLEFIRIVVVTGALMFGLWGLIKIPLLRNKQTDKSVRDATEKMKNSRAVRAVIIMILAVTTTCALLLYKELLSKEELKELGQISDELGYNSLEQYSNYGVSMSNIKNGMKFMELVEVADTGSVRSYKALLMMNIVEVAYGGEELNSVISRIADESNDGKIYISEENIDKLSKVREKLAEVTSLIRNRMPEGAGGYSQAIKIAELIDEKFKTIDKLTNGMSIISFNKCIDSFNSINSYLSKMYTELIETETDLIRILIIKSVALIVVLIVNTLAVRFLTNTIYYSTVSSKIRRK